MADTDREQEDSEVEAPDQAAAVDLLIERLGHIVGLTSIAVVGHRVVHGGNRFYRPELITPEILKELRRIVPYDPDHLPGEIGAIEAFRRLDPELPQVACFDTAFHHDSARRPDHRDPAAVRGGWGPSLRLPRPLLRLSDGGAGPGRRPGGSPRSRHPCPPRFRGEPGGGPRRPLPRDDDGLHSDLRTGHGHALRRYRSRLGSVPDAGRGLTIDQFHDLVNHESGLLGVSETSPDLRDLLSRQDDDVRAAEAVALFCYRAKTWLGALAAALGGLDTLVFAGGIGENSPEARRRICEGLEFLGIALDERRNAANSPLISTENGQVTVRVIPTDEESLIARPRPGSFLDRGQP